MFDDLILNKAMLLSAAWSLVLFNRKPLLALLTHSKVLCCQSVGSVAIFADQRGGVALLAAVVALPIGARYLADGGCEDHLDAACVVPNCERRRHNEGEKQRDQPVIHRTRLQEN